MLATSVIDSTSMSTSVGLSLVSSIVDGSAVVTTAASIDGPNSSFSDAVCGADGSILSSSELSNEGSEVVLDCLFLDLFLDFDGDPTVSDRQTSGASTAVEELKVFTYCSISSISGDISGSMLGAVVPESKSSSIAEELCAVSVKLRFSGSVISVEAGFTSPLCDSLDFDGFSSMMTDSGSKLVDVSSEDGEGFSISIGSAEVSAAVIDSAIGSNCSWQRTVVSVSVSDGTSTGVEMVKVGPSV